MYYSQELNYLLLLMSKDIIVTVFRLLADLVNICNMYRGNHNFYQFYLYIVTASSKSNIF